MMELPKEISHMIKTIEDAGYEAYAVGGCVRDSILGKHPEDWDLTSNASRDILGTLFPNAAIINKKLGVMRITEGEVTADIAAFRIDGEYKDYRRPETVIFTEEIVEDLRRRDFTMNAIAVNPIRGVVDPYDGRLDIGKKLIRGIGEPRLRFEEDALRILRGIRFAAQLDFKVDSETIAAMKEKANLLAYISVERIREEFSKTMMAQNSGRGLTLLIETGVLAYILGQDCMGNVTESELERLTLLAGNINNTECELKYRVALVYLCFERDKALVAMEKMAYSNEMKKLLQHAVCFMDELAMIEDSAELKRFINRIGLEYYRYLIGLSLQRSKAFRFNDADIKKRITIFETIQRNGEAIFIEDLAVNGNDMKEMGILEGVEIGKILNHLLDAVHQTPEKNEKSRLLQIAKKDILSTC